MMDSIILLFVLIIVSSISIIIIVRSKVEKKRKRVVYEAPEAKGGLPLIGHLHLLGGPIPIFRKFSAMADKYGPILSIKLGFHRTVVVSSREIAKECLSTIDKAFATRPNIAAGRYMGYNNAFFALAPYGEYWREMRKIATLELLSAHRLQKLQHVRDSEIFSLLKHLFLTHRNKTSFNFNHHFVDVPISTLLEHLTFNINARIIAGKRFPGFGEEKRLSEEEREAWKLKKGIRDATYLSGVFVEADALPLGLGLGIEKWVDFQGHVRSMNTTAAQIDSVLHKWLQQHLQNNAHHHTENDFMDVLISIFANQTQICGHKREIVIKATALTLMLTGTGSTAITLTWALSLLLNHPNVLKKAQEELDSHIGTHTWVQESDIKELHYLQAIIKETLRLYPPAPLTGIREAMQDCSLAGYHVPKGTRLLVNIWKIQRDPQIWSNPNEFQPERFLKDPHQHLEFKGGMNFEYIPFSFGRRSCPGMTFGLQVINLTLARLLQGFDMSVTEPVDMSEGLGVALPKLNPLHLMLKPRLPLELYETL